MQEVNQFISIHSRNVHVNGDVQKEIASYAAKVLATFVCLKQDLVTENLQTKDQSLTLQCNGYFYQVISIITSGCKSTEDADKPPNDFESACLRNMRYEMELICITY